MRKAQVYNFGVPAGILYEYSAQHYRFEYNETYQGSAISLTMPISQKSFEYKNFPPFFDGLLPEGMMLEALLKHAKIDRKDYFEQLVTVGADLVGSVTIDKLV